jgi:hypothetical protein
MADRLVVIPTADISKEISNFTIGLARLEVRPESATKPNNLVQDAFLSGTGTLVSVEKIYGLLTAAHVLKELPAKGEVGIILFKDGALQRQAIKMAHVEPPLMISGEKFGPDGPDLGFLRFPPVNEGWLKALASFYNLAKHREDALAEKKPALDYIESVIGMIEKLTKEIPAEKPLGHAKQFSAIFCNGQAQNSREAGGFDLIDLVIKEYPDFPLPANFKGMSGGALWRLFLNERNGVFSVVSKLLVGVPFYQSEDAAANKIVTCHGKNSIYTTLLDKVMARWPEETS